MLSSHGREIARVPLRGEGSCGGGGAPRDSAGSGAQEFRSGLQSSPGDLPDPGIKPISLISATLAGGSLPLHTVTLPGRGQLRKQAGGCWLKG